MFGIHVINRLSLKKSQYLFVFYVKVALQQKIGKSVEKSLVVAIIITNNCVKCVLWDALLQ